VHFFPLSGVEGEKWKLVAVQTRRVMQRAILDVVLFRV
jgi:hypothetical protein